MLPNVLIMTWWLSDIHFKNAENYLDKGHKSQPILLIIIKWFHILGYPQASNFFHFKHLHLASSHKCVCNKVIIHKYQYNIWPIAIG